MANTESERGERPNRGFAAMDPERQREIARKGGPASPQEQNLQGVNRSEAGRKGGEAVVQKYGPGHMAEIGRRGGEARGAGGGRSGARGRGEREGEGERYREGGGGGALAGMEEGRREAAGKAGEASGGGQRGRNA